MKKIAIIGANSYIARNLIFSLKSQTDCYVKLYDRSKQQIDGEQNYFPIDILDKVSVDTIDMNCDLIYMFIGKTGSVAGFDDYRTFIDVNEIAFLNVLNSYKKQKSKAKIVFPSTRLVYKGKLGTISEDDEKEFKTIYAINKYSCEQYLKQFHNVFGVKYLIFRICLPYGTMIPGAISYGTAEMMISKASKNENITIYGDGSLRRTVIHMEDLCNIMIQASFSDACNNDVYNIGGEDYSLKEMAELIAYKYHVNIQYTEWPKTAELIESGNTVFNDNKLRTKFPGISYTHKFKDWCAY